MGIDVRVWWPRRRHDAPPSPEEQLQLWSAGDARLDPPRALRTPPAVRPEVLDRRPLHLPHMPRRQRRTYRRLTLIVSSVPPRRLT